MTLSCVATAASTRLAAGAQTPGAQMPGVQAPAAPASPPYVIEEMTTEHRVEENGSGRKRIRAKVKIATPAGVTEWGTLLFPYMAATEEISIQQLVVEKPDGRQVKAGSLSLEEVAAPGEIDTPILSDYRAKKIAVPALEPGDRLIYDVVFIRSSSLIPGQFWFDHQFTRTSVVIQESLEVDAPASRPLNVRVRRGSEVPTGAAAAGRVVRRWAHQQMVAIAVPTTTEALQALTDDVKEGPDIRVSSFRDWQQLGAWFAGVIDAKVEPDDTVRARARELTRGLDTPEQRLAALYTFVSTQIRYIGLAVGSSRLEPRSASQVLATQYGDCKDKHVLLASLARALDLVIEPVLISTTLTLDEQIPTPSQFDHLISVRTAADTAAWHWMDTTSGALPTGVLLQPLRGKRALLIPTRPLDRGSNGGATAAAATIAGARGAAIVTTPADRGEPTAMTIDIAGTMTNELLTLHVVRRYTGDLEYTLRMIFQSSPQADFSVLGKQYAAEDNIAKATIKDTSVKDEGLGKGVVVTYDASLPYWLTYDKPWQIWLPTPLLQPTQAPKATDTDVDLELVDITLNVKYDVPASVRARPPVPISLDREFATYTSSYRVDGQTLFLERRLRTRTTKIVAAQMDGYRAFLRAIDADFRQQFAVDAIPRTSTPPQTASELNGAGYRALQKGQARESIELLKRATALDPQSKAAWNNLGRAYNWVREYGLAVEALERQIAINPYDEYAYTNLGAARWGQQRYDDAIAAYKKQIEIVPLDKYAHADLGRLYLQLKRYDEAIASLERAVGVTPENGSAWATLGQARLARNDVDEAAKALARAVEVTPAPWMWNSAAWAFAEKGVKLDVAEQYVRKAIDSIAAQQQNVTLEPLVPAQAVAANHQEHYWDTLGWIHYQAGDLAKAEPWLRAAWILGQDPMVGGHLAQVYEKQGNRARAIEVYAQAASAGAAQPASRAALERLVGAGQVDKHLAAARTSLVEQRTIKLPRLVPGAARADVSLLTGADGRVTRVQFTKGDESLRAPIGTLKGLKTPAFQPDPQTMTFIRQAVVGCSPTSGCLLVLLRPSDVPAPAAP